MSTDAYTSNVADSIPDNILERIQKMLALAEGSKNEGEAANALAMAQQMLQKYNLDISSVRDHRRADDLGQVTDSTFEFGSKRQYRGHMHRTRADQPWVTMIAKAVARGTFCRVIINTYTIYFIGRERNVNASMYMFQNVIEQVEDFAKAAVQANNKRVKSEYGVSDIHYLTGQNNPKVYRQSWLLGAASTIQTRLAQQRAEFERSTSTERSTDGSAAPVIHTGMEVIITADTEADEYMDEKFYGGRARKQREWEARWKLEAAQRASEPREVFVDTRTDKEKARDAKREQKRAEHDEQKERNYYRRWGHHSWEQRASNGPSINYGAYQQGTSDARKVSLDSGKVNTAARKQIGGK